MKFRIILEGRVKDTSAVLDKTTFLVANDACILASSIEDEAVAFDTSRPYLSSVDDISNITKRGELVEGALTLSPSRKMMLDEFVTARFTLLETRQIGNKTELILEDDTYLSVYARTMIEIGAITHIMIGGYKIEPYESIRVFKDSVIFLKETNHFVNIFR